MLNLKKGLALVLAAATAFTFAPVSTLSANAAATTTSDGFTTTKGIDSIDFSSLTLESDNLTDTGASARSAWDSSAKTILLKEHNDKSSNGTAVKSYRIKVERAVDKDNANKYSSVIKVETGNKRDLPGFTTDDSYREREPEVEADTTWGNTEVTTSSINDTVPYSYSKVNNYDGVNPNATMTGEASKATLYKINGAYVKFSLDLAAYQAANTNQTSFKVTVYSLDHNKDSLDRAEELDSSTFTINLKTNALSLKIDTSKVSPIIAENDVVTIPFTLNNNGSGVNHPKATSVRVSGQTDGYVKDGRDVDNFSRIYKFEPTFNGSFAATKTSVNGYVTFKALTTGSIKVYVNAIGTDDDNSNRHVLASQALNVKITEGNGHLYVSYNTDQAGKLTFTDDPAVTNSTAQQTANPLVKTHATTTNAVNGDGQLRVYTKKVAGTSQWNLSANGGMNEQFTQAVPSTDSGVVYRAQTLVADGQKTVQIEASATPSAKISYALVTFGGYYDKSANKVLSSIPAEADQGQGDYVIYSEQAAARYGGVDQNGLVTLKKDDDISGLYVVVTAQGSNSTETTAARKTSTYIIPITLAANTPAYVYASDKENTADAQTYYNDATSSWGGTLYLSLKGRKSTELVTSTNAGEDYLKIATSDPSVVKVSGKTITAVKKGEANITVQNSASPQASGIAIATLHVVVNENADTTAVSGKGVSVNKEKPYAQVEVTPSASDANVKFDSALYKKDANYPSGYSRILPKDDHYGDVTVSSTGHVAYQKNNGTVFVRAQVVADDKYNASPYVYIPVNYGQTVVDTELNVDQTPIVLDVKGTKQISATASSGASISYKSADPTVASVDEKGLVTANKSGYTTVTVTATSADGKTGDSAVITVIVKGNETITTNDVKKPSKVTGVKVKNKKGAKVTVSWTKQSQKNVKYYVKKTVGKKSAGKSVNGNKTTLSVAKGKTVKVKVKAYIYNAKGTKLVGSYSKTVTLKTDKK